MTTENPVRWFEIYVQDMDRAKKFYEEVLALKLERLETADLEMWAFPMGMDKTGSGGALVKMEGMPSGGNSVLVYFGSDECSELERVKGAGGRVIKEKMSIGQYGFIGLVMDTEGNIFGLHSMR